jgi:tetratricopeptide (TPR) repeat protein
MWTKGQDSDAAKMKLATASLLVETKETANEGVKILEESLGTATDEGTKTNIEVSLILGYQNLEQYEKMWNLARELGKKYAESKSVFESQEFALRSMGKTAEADELARTLLRKNQDNLEAMRALVFNSQAKGDYEAARSRGLDIEKAGKAEGFDLNGIAWNSLFTGKTDATDLEFARKATQMLQNNPGILHTLGCVYAALGKTQEAREVLVQAMDALGLDEPDDNYWYAFGRIAEQYGLTDVAVADYKKIEKPAEMPQVPSSSWLLAQSRLTVLGTAGAKSYK